VTRLTVVLLTLLLLAGPAFAYRVCWDASEGATLYRVYWTLDHTFWTPFQSVDTTETCVADPAPEPALGQVVYFVVTAINAVGESETEHGPII